MGCMCEHALNIHAVIFCAYNNFQCFLYGTLESGHHELSMPSQCSLGQHFISDKCAQSN